MILGLFIFGQVLLFSGRFLNQDFSLIPYTFFVFVIIYIYWKLLVIINTFCKRNNSIIIIYVLYMSIIFYLISHLIPHSWTQLIGNYSGVEYRLTNTEEENYNEYVEKFKRGYLHKCDSECIKEDIKLRQDTFNEENIIQRDLYVNTERFITWQHGKATGFIPCKNCIKTISTEGFISGLTSFFNIGFMHIYECSIKGLIYFFPFSILLQIIFSLLIRRRQDSN
jgi:hypothetical protein